MNPPVFGYLRVREAAPDLEVRREEQQLARWAGTEGYRLVRVYREADEGGIAVLSELVDALNRTGTRAVVMPSVRHLGVNRLLQDHLWAHLVDGARADVFEVSEG
ncbi:hypothetical protein [Streptomyces tremellae]|uniref:Resolvase/invertase-type recombinase catalytic domain-containing protein n=1 Tax=Streptomyces tremellae TaxID=1124239 RepID=A0ABP7FCP3_9ACTN